MIYIMIVLPLLSVIFWGLMSWIILIAPIIWAIVFCAIAFYIFFCINILGFYIVIGEIDLGPNNSTEE